MDEHDHPVGVERQEEPPRRRPLTWAVAIVLFIVALAWVAAWSRQTPAVLQDGDASSFPAGPDRGPFHLTVVQPATSGSVDDVSIVEIVPVVSRNTADATIDFVVCTPRSGQPVLLAESESLDKACSRTRPAEDTTLRAAGEYVVMTISPEQAGTVRVTGIEVTYRQGWQLLWLPRTAELALSTRVKVT